jgi:hypothetical protein
VAEAVGCLGADAGDGGEVGEGGEEAGGYGGGGEGEGGVAGEADAGAATQFDGLGGGVVGGQKQVLQEVCAFAVVEGVGG